ncbi:MAG: GNAT family N-acetyltransferase [Pseudomonadota bacterium]
MSVALTLATLEHAETVLSLVSAFHAEEGLNRSDEARADGVLPLLKGTPHGALYLVGPLRAPIGYVALGFGWSIEFGGNDGFIDELYIRPPVRRRGLASEVLRALPVALAAAGVTALHLEVDSTNTAARRLYESAGFKPRAPYQLMTRTLSAPMSGT